MDEAVSKDQDKDLYLKYYESFNQSVYNAYDKLRSFARDHNAQMNHPEVVILGPISHGKSSLLEAIIGYQFNHVGLGFATKRPLYINYVINPEANEPKITLKRNIMINSPGADRDMVVTLDKLGGEISKRMDKVGKEVVFVQFESNKTTNITYIDTPGIPDEDSPDYDQVIDIVTNIAKVPNRILICVEEASDYSKLRMTKIIKTVDPDLSRTIFAYTKFNTQVQLLNSMSLVNRYLNSIIIDPKTFLVSLPSLKVRRKQTTSESFQKVVYQAFRRDVNNLEQLQYDKRFDRNIGIFALRNFLNNLIWKQYQEGIPEVLKCMKVKKQETEKFLQAVKNQQQELVASKFREISSNYSVEFLQTIERLIVGTSEGIPSINGQTLEEEKSAQGDADWVDSYNHPIQFDPEKSNVPYYNTKIYGGQQFERLLAEFKAICDRTEIKELSMDDIATASGINKVNNVPNNTWAAADLVQQQIQETFIPIIEQLQKRAVYIMKRLYDITDRILSSKKKKLASSSSQSTSIQNISNVYQYPYFTNYIKDLFIKFVERQSKVCKEKCMDEFYSSKTIFWELTEFTDFKLPTDSEQNPELSLKAVSKLASDLFNSIRDRISTNVILKLYNFFLVPIQLELWNEIQVKVSTMTDEQLDQYFQINSIKEKIKGEEKVLETKLLKIEEQMNQFSELAQRISNPSSPEVEEKPAKVNAKTTTAKK